MNIRKKTFLFYAMLCMAAQMFAQGPNGSGTYYQPANGRKGQSLKTALYGVITKHTNVGYDGLWSCYHKTDRRADGKLWDMYSNTTNFVIGGSAQGHNYSKEGDGYNREHSMPKSWFNEGSPMKSDLVHVVPTDGYVNNRRSNYPFGETDGGTYKSNGGFSKVGTCTTSGYSGVVFEPNDEYKGDFARIYFYMATCYEDKIQGWSSPMLAGNKYPVYKDSAIQMLLRWAEEDPVSQKEIDRNNAAYELQGNRNPFVDYPGLEQYVWGNKKDVAFSYDNYDGTNPNPDPNPDPDPDPNPDPDPDPNPEEGAVTYKKITSTADLQTGTAYLIVCEDAKEGVPVAMGASDGDIRSVVAVDVKNGTITTDVNEDGKPRQMILGGSVGAYTLYDEKENVYLALTSDGNKIHYQSDASANNAKWTVTFSGENANIKSNAYSNRSIQYNISAPRFACYKPGQKPVMLYKKEVTTGISGTMTGGTLGKVCVYSLTGVLVRSNVDRANAFKGLPKGIYIIGKNKYVVR